MCPGRTVSCPVEPSSTSRPLRCAPCCPAYVTPVQADLPSERIECCHHSGGVALGEGAGGPRGSHHLTLQGEGAELRGTHPAGLPEPQVTAWG